MGRIVVVLVVVRAGVSWIVALGWVSRITAIALTLVNTRLLVDAVGLQGLAAQAIVASLAPWIMLLNLGLPASVQNLISEWRAQGLDLQTLRDTAGRLAVATWLVFAPVSVGIAWAVKHLLLSGYGRVSTWSVAVAMLLLLVGALAAVLTSVLYAEHRSLWPNLSPGVSALSLSGLLLTVSRLAPDDVDLMLAAYFVPTALTALVSVGLLRLRFRTLLNRDCARLLLRRSRGFLLVATLGTATLSIDYLILSHVLNGEDLAIYNLTGRIFLVIPVIHGVLLAASWTPMADLFARQAFAEGRRYVARVVGAGVGLALLSGGAASLLVPRLLELLSGRSALRVPLSMLLLWWGYVLIRAWSDTFYTALQSLGQTRTLRNYLFVQAPISVGLQVLLGQRYGAQGVLVGIIASFLLTCAWYLPFETHRMTDRAT